MAKKPEDCEHDNLNVVAVFADESSKTAYLYQVCDQYGQDFLLLGKCHPTIY